nr:transposon TX1 putative 149 kDa protein [Tanacetum cinerariifolium]
MEEVKEVVLNCASSKAPGPDGKDPLVLNDYRPISLIGCTYKVISKILASRLANVMHKLINPNQTAFLARRLILDDSLIENEIVNFSKCEEARLLLAEEDFEKDFDSVLTLEACSRRLYNRVSLANDGSNIYLLQLADDALFFCKWSSFNAINLVRMLKCFQDASGLKVNLSKSRIYSVGVPILEVFRLGDLLRARAQGTDFDLDSLEHLLSGLSLQPEKDDAETWNADISVLHSQKSISCPSQIIYFSFSSSSWEHTHPTQKHHHQYSPPPPSLTTLPILTTTETTVPPTQTTTQEPNHYSLGIIILYRIKIGLYSDNFIEPLCVSYFHNMSNEKRWVEFKGKLIRPPFQRKVAPTPEGLQFQELFSVFKILLGAATLRVVLIAI